jgi:lipopolysaccharide export system protein LptA
MKKFILGFGLAFCFGLFATTLAGGTLGGDTVGSTQFWTNPSGNLIEPISPWELGTITAENLDVTGALTAGTFNFSGAGMNGNILLNDFWLSNDGGDEGLRVDDSGNVGIGTASPSRKLSVAGELSAQSTIYVDSMRYANSGIYKGDASVGFLNFPSDNNISITNANFGIGTTSPSAKLDIDTPDNVSALRITSAENGGSSSVSSFTASTAGFNSDVISMSVGSSAGGSANFLRAINGGTDVFSVSKTGLVYSADSVSIEKAGTVTTTTDFVNLTNTGNDASMTATGTGIGFYQSPYEDLTPVQSGRISVETDANWTSTTSTQDSDMVFETALNGSLVQELKIETGDGILLPTGTRKIKFGGNNTRIQGSSSGEIGFHTGDGTVAMYIDDHTNNHNVGIGTSSPSSKLHVALDSGTIPSIGSDFSAIFTAGATNGTNNRVAILAGRSASSTLYFGDQDNATSGKFNYDNATDSFALNQNLKIDSNGANTASIMTLENTAGDIQIFRVDATPEGSVTGSIGDLAIDGTNGALYIKATGTGTNTGWTSL